MIEPGLEHGRGLDHGRWLEDTADRLEAAAELVRDVHDAAATVSRHLGEHLGVLAERLDRAARRLAFARLVAADVAAETRRMVIALERLVRLGARAAHAEGLPALAEALETIAEELGSVRIELDALTAMARSAEALGARTGGTR